MLNLLTYENNLWNQDITVIAGVDEVGRGCLAGPIVAAAVSWNKDYILDQQQKLIKVLEELSLKPEDLHQNSIKRKVHKYLIKRVRPSDTDSDDSYNDLAHLIFINDSKRVTEQRRGVLEKFIKEKCQAWSIIEIPSKEIDEIGIANANKKALALAAFKIPNIEHLLTDHFSILQMDADAHSQLQETCITKGDSLSLSIASASIIAKVYRDNLMKTKYHKLYPQYGFDKNVGYGTAEHIHTVKTIGQCAIHRKSFHLN